VNSFKEFLIQRCTDFHVKIYYESRYVNNEQGTYEKLKDMIRYEELKEVIRNHPSLDIEEIGKEVSERVRKRVSL